MIRQAEFSVVDLSCRQSTLCSGLAKLTGAKCSNVALNFDTKTSREGQNPTKILRFEFVLNFIIFLREE